MFPQIIKALRTERNLAQHEVASYLGISRPAYTAYEAGKRQPDFMALTKLASFFNVSTDYLLGYSASDTHPQPLITANQRTIAAYIDADVTEAQMKEIMRYIDLIKMENEQKKNN